jgi:competence protein ComFC
MFKAKSVNLLKRIINTKPQAKLQKNERLNNLTNAFKIDDLKTRPPPEIIIFLVDDVTTTGATLNECAKVLKDNGYTNIYGLTIC